MTTNHLFIGPPSAQVFLCRLEAKNINSTKSVILFYPFGQEYMRAHKAFKQLASLLTRKGYDVYRFDYPGTGDSCGDETNTSFCDYLSASNLVIGHLSSQQQYSSISAIGLRLGALVAATVASQNKSLSRVVLWDPIADGELFIQDSIEQSDLKDHGSTGNWGIHGFPLSQKFRQDIAPYDLTTLSFPEHQEFSLIHSCENMSTEKVKRSELPKLSVTLVPPENDWNYVDMEGSILMPSTIIKTIVDRF